MPGPQLAWESEAHMDMTLRAVASDAEDFMMEDSLPPKFMRDRIFSVLKCLPPAVVETDVTVEQYMDIGQSQHFMRFRGQPKVQAYSAGLQMVLGRLVFAVQKFNERKPAADVASILAESVHALQDSFSPAHVQRTQQGKKLVITDIFVWADQDKKKHEAGDASWRTSNGRLTPLGEACVTATRLLLASFVFRVINRNDDAARVLNDLLDRYLTEQLNKEDRPHSPWVD